MQQFPMVATTLMGLENVLAQEIANLGGQNIKILKRAVKFEADEATLYSVNLTLRTALRILVPIDHFLANDEEELYQKIKKYPWEKHIDNSNSFRIETSVSSLVFRHSKYVALKSKDAIVDRFREKTGRRPNIERENPDLIINLHIHENFVEVSLDSTGVSLDRRGYRKEANEAPINEVLAAGIILMSGWDRKVPFYDSMSGSGTFGIEAALIATRTAPGLNRNFAFENWKDFDSVLFNKVRRKIQAERKETEIPIFCKDIEGLNLDIISQNASNAGMDEFISLKKEDFFLSKPKTESGFIFLNPPYGERLKINQTDIFYAQIGDTLKQNYAGFEAWIISSNFDALKKIGLKATQKINLVNGGLDAKLQQYELFKGSKRQ